jgi:ribosome-binding factor A
VSEYRLKRIQNLLREQVSEMIMREVIKDPRVNTMLSITEVKISKDLAYADLFVSSFEGHKKLERSVEALNHAAGFIQHKLKSVLRLRTTPILRFKADPGIEYGFEISKKIDALGSGEIGDDGEPEPGTEEDS